MWGHPFLLLRDIAVNESDQERVSDSGAIRSGLVPQLGHSAIHKRSLTRRTLSVRCIPALAEALQPPVAGEAPSTGRKVGGCDGEHARSVVPWRWPMHTGECHAVRALEPNATSLDLRNDCSSVTLHRLRRLLAPIASARIAIICAPAIDCLELRPRCYSTGSRLWSRPSGRQSPVAARAVASKWAFAGPGGSGYLMPARCTRGSRRCLNGWL